jgi:hypothetical protein
MGKVDLNQVIAELSIAMKLDRSFDPIIARYGIETGGEAMQFIQFENQDVPEIEEDYELEEEAGIERLEDERQSEEFYKSLAEE